MCMNRRVYAAIYGVLYIGIMVLGLAMSGAVYDLGYGWLSIAILIPFALALFILRYCYKKRSGPR